MRQTEAMASSTFFSSFHPSLLRVENAAGSTLSTTLSSFILTALAAGTALSTYVVLPLLFIVDSTDIVFLLLHLDLFQPSLAAVDPVEENGSKRLVADEVTAG